MTAVTHRIHFTATTEIRMPIDDLSLILLGGGVRPGAGRTPLRPSTVRDEVELRDGPGPGISEPSPLWLIRTPGLTILVDSGLRADHVDHANRCFVERGERQFYVALESPAEFLARHDLTPDDIDVVILTHLHLDHFPNAAEYRNARIVVHEDELVAAIAPPPYNPFHWPEFRPYLLEVVPQLEVVGGDTRICDGVDVWHVGGHAPGQLAVAVSTALGTTVLASDFFNTYENIDNAWPPGIYTSVPQWESSARRVLRDADVIVPGHDWAVWDRYPGGVIG